MENEKILTDKKRQMFLKDPRRIAALNAVKFAYGVVELAIKVYETNCNLSRPVAVINGDAKVLSQAAVKLQAAVDELNDIENAVFAEITGQEEKPSVLEPLREKQDGIARQGKDSPARDEKKDLSKKERDDYEK